jgi:hypothetical protein
MNQNFSDVMKQLKSQHEENLKQMPLPDGVEDFLKAKMLEQDSETIVFMMKLAWVFGAQAGQHAVAQAQMLESQPPQKRRVEA